MVCHHSNRGVDGGKPALVRPEAEDLTVMPILGTQGFDTYGQSCPINQIRIQMLIQVPLDTSISCDMLVMKGCQRQSQAVKQLSLHESLLFSELHISDIKKYSRNNPNRNSERIKTCTLKNPKMVAGMSQAKSGQTCKEMKRRTNI